MIIFGWAATGYRCVCLFVCLFVCVCVCVRACVHACVGVCVRLFIGEEILPDIPIFARPCNPDRSTSHLIQGGSPRSLDGLQVCACMRACVCV